MLDNSEAIECLKGSLFRINQKLEELEKIIISHTEQLKQLEILKKDLMKNR